MDNIVSIHYKVVDNIARPPNKVVDNTARHHYRMVEQHKITRLVVRRKGVGEFLPREILPWPSLLTLWE